MPYFQLHDRTCGHFDLAAFAAKNPQIRGAELQICGQIENIAAVNELFPSLESLRLQLRRQRSASAFVGSVGSPLQPAGLSSGAPRDAVDVVRLRNVKNFTLDLMQFYGRVNEAGDFINLSREKLAEDNLSSIVFDRLDYFKYMTSFDINCDSPNRLRCPLQRRDQAGFQHRWPAVCRNEAIG